MTLKDNLDNELLQYIDGLMLGDGCILKRKTKGTIEIRYQQSFAHRYKEWAQKIQSDFDEFGIDTRLAPIITKIKDKEYKGWYLRTRGDANKNIFPTLWKRWHNDRMIVRGNKIVELKTVPFDINLLPPQLLALWYLGDGNYDKANRRCILATGGFTNEEVLMLCRKLSRTLLIKTRVDTRNCICMTISASLVFLDYIRDYKLDCFSYKWGEYDF